MELAAKQRILGGVILVALAVLFLPVLLNGAGVASWQSPQIPVKPALPSEASLAPVLDEKAAALQADIDEHRQEPTFFPIQPKSAEPSAEASTERFHIVDAIKSEPAATTTTDKPQEKSYQKTKPVVLPSNSQTASLSHSSVAMEPKKPAAVPAPTAAPQAWVVQVASLSSQAAADELVAKLRAKGLRAAVGRVGSAFKVSVGPELDRGLAEALKARINNDSSLGLTGFIVPYRP